MDFTEDRLKHLLSGNGFVRSLDFLTTVDSTNRFASKHAMNGAEEGAVVIADSQTGGRGRLGRVWQSPPGVNLYLSVILRPVIETFRAPQLTLMAGVALAETLREYGARGITIKWPNDVLIGGRKVSGILTEIRTARGKIDFVVVGMGVNINMEKARFYTDFRQTPTSLKEETSRSHSRSRFTVRLLESFVTWYERYCTEGFAPVRKEWMEYSGICGKFIKVTDRDTVKEGTVVGLDENGALLLEEPDGAATCVLSGDVTIIGE